MYTLVPIFWALYNAIPPGLFFIYFFTKARPHAMCLRCETHN